MQCTKNDNVTPCNVLKMDGYMILNDLLTLSDEYGFKAISSPTDGNYMNNGFDKYSKPLIRCENNKCQSIEGTTGYYINAKDYSKLIRMQCSDNSSCSADLISNPEVGYYYGDTVIKCNESKCEEIVDSDDVISNTICGDNEIGKLSSDSKKTMFCVKNNKNTVEYTNKEAYYFLGEVSNGSIFENKGNVLVQTGNNAVVIVKSTGMFVDSYDNSNIKCDNTGCAEFNINSLESDCSKTTNNDVFIKNENSDGLMFCPPSNNDLHRPRNLEIRSTQQNSPIDINSDVIRYITMEIEKGTNLPFKRRREGYEDKIVKIGGGQVKEVKLENLNLKGGQIINCGYDSYEKPLTKCSLIDNRYVNCDNNVADIGYYLNAVDDTKKTIIKCDSSTHCNIISPPTGYYININAEGNNVIECSGTCEIMEASNFNDNSNNIEIGSSITINMKEGRIINGHKRRGENTEEDIETLQLIELGNEENIFGKNTYVLVNVKNNSVTLIESKGFFINGGEDHDEYPIIKCTTTTNCQKIGKDEYDIVKTSCSRSGVGNLIKSGNNVKHICLSTVDGSEIDITETTETYYLITLPNDNTPFGVKDKPVLIKSGNNKVIPVDLSSITTSGYYINSGSDRTIKPLIYCSNPGPQISCTKISSNNGYYLNLDNNNGNYPLIQCINNSCSPVDVSSLKSSCKESANGTPINVLGNIYFCPTTNYGETVKLDKSGVYFYFVNMLKETHTPFFNKEKIGSDNVNVLVKIEKDSITVISSPIGYFRNSGKESSEYPIIKCLNGNCETITKSGINDKTTCDKSGELIYDTAESGYKFCYDKTKSPDDLTSENYYFMEISENQFSSFTNGFTMNNGILIRISVGAVELIYDDGYYVESDSKLIYCENKSCNTKAFAEDQFYLNAAHGNKPIIKCIDEHSCEISEGALNSYYFNNGDGNSLIYCESINNCSIILNPTNGYYKNSGNEGNIIKCDLNNCVDISTSDNANSGNVVSDCSDTSGGNLMATNLYLCNGDSNNSLDSIDMTKTLYYLIRIGNGNTSPFKASSSSLRTRSEVQTILVNSGNNAVFQVNNPRNGYYLSDANNSKLIQYLDGEYTEIANANQGYYLNADDEQAQYPIIYCDDSTNCQKIQDSTDIIGTSCLAGKLLSENSSIKHLCLNENNADKVDITNNNYSYYVLSIDNTNQSGAYSTLLTGQVNVGSRKDQLLRVGKYSVTVITTSDGEYYLNSGNDASNKPLIYCSSSSTCTTTIASNGDYVVNAVDHQSLIYCESNNNGGVICSVNQSTLNSNGSQYYLNAGGDKTTNQIIKCTYTTDSEGNGNITCLTESSPTIEGTEYYLNSGENNTNQPLIKCTFARGNDNAACSIVLKSSINLGTGYYLNGDEDRVTKQLIKCTLASNSANVSCIKDSSTLKAVGTEYYVNSGENKTNQPLIKCTFVDGGSAASCISEASNLQSVGYEYYLNYGGDSETKPLIKCINDGKGTVCSTVSTNNNNKVIYINGAINSGITSSLIECVSNVCEIKNGHVNDIYVNNDASTLTDALIICNSNCAFDNGKENSGYLNSAGSQLTQAIISCDETKCTSVDARNGCYYINSVSIGLTNAIIKCSSTGCTQDDAVDGNHYINYAAKNLSSSIISCNAKGCSVNEAKNGDHYINSAATDLTNAIINCGTTSCTADQANQNDYYINSTADDLTNALIKCDNNHCFPETATNESNYINSSANNLNNAIISCNLGKCSTIDAKVLNVYINSGDNGKLIQCLTSSCKIIENSGTDDRPKYYINGAIEQDNDYTGLLIKCNTSQKCVKYNGTVNSIYLNDNFNTDSTKGDTQHPLIHCLNKECIAITNKATTTDPVYYVNAIGITNAQYSGLLIKCSNTCIETSGAAQAIYLNANYNTDATKGDTVNELIQCLGNECKAMPSAIVNEQQPLYYINGAKVTDQQYRDLLILCPINDKCRKTDGHVHDIYLNANFNSNPEAGDTTNTLIQCLGSTCKAIASPGTNANPVFYVNAGKTAFNKDSLIICESTCTTQKGTEGDIYLNGHFNSNAELGDTQHPLIICTEEVCSSNKANVGFYLSTKDKSGNNYQKLIECNGESCTIGSNNAELGFYISAIDKTEEGHYPKLIECSENTCEKMVTTNPGFYISGNDKEIESGDYAKLILCADDDCNTISGTHGYYLLNNKIEDRIVYGNGNNSYKKISDDIIGEAQCENKNDVGNLIKIEDDNNYYLCIGEGTHSEISWPFESAESTSVYYIKITNAMQWVSGDIEKEVLMKISDQSIVPTSIDDADASRHIYIVSTTGLSSNDQTFNECHLDGSITRFSLSGDGQTIENTSICSGKCYPDTEYPHRCNVGYYLLDDQSSAITEMNMEGTLYYCDTADSCQKITEEELPLGYLRNVDKTTKASVPYFECSLTANKVICKTIPITATTCASVGIGNLIKTEEARDGSILYKVCIQGTSSDKGVTLDPTLSTSYLFPMKASSIFNKKEQNGTYLVLDIKNGSVLLHQSTQKLYYLYANNDNRIFDKNEVSEEKTNYCETHENLQEYKLKEQGENTNYYEKNN